MRRVVLEALVAALFVGVGSFLLYDSVDEWGPVTDDGSDSIVPSIKQSLTWALQKFHILVSDAPMPCGDGNTTVLSLNGSCAFLDGRAGCCTTPPSIPAVTDTSCSSACLGPWTGYWCHLSCVAFNVNKTQMCKSAATQLFDSCSKCQGLQQYFKGAQTVDAWASKFGYQLIDNTPCINFMDGVPAADTAAPALTFSIPTAVTVSTVSQLTFNVSATSKSAPVHSSFVLTLTSGQVLLKVNAKAARWSKVGTDSWLFSMTLQLSNLAPSGVYTFTANVRNGGGVTTKAQDFTVTTEFTGTSISTWDLCTSGTGVDGSAVPSGVTDITSLSCCGATCSLSAPAGAVVGLDNFDLQGAAELRSFSLRIRRQFTMGAGAVSLTIVQKMLLFFEAGSSTVIQQNMLMVSDATSRILFRRRSVFRIVSRMLNCAARSFSETTVEIASGARIQISGANGNFATNGTVALAGDLDANTTATTSEAITLENGSSFTGAGRVRMGKGKGMFRGGMLTTQIFLEPFVRVVSVGARVNVNALTSQGTFCGTSAADLSVSAGSAAVVDTAASCVAVAGSPTAAVLANGAVTVNAGGGLKFTGVSASSGILDVKGSVDFKTGSLVEIEMVSGFLANITTTTSAVEIPVMRYTSSAQGTTAAACTTTATGAEVTEASGASLAARTPVVSCRAAGAGSYLLVVTFPATTVPTTPAAPVASFTSGQTYSLTLSKECNTFTDDQFKATVQSHLSVTPAEIQVVRRSCGSMVLFFRCLSSTAAADAEATCGRIVAEANRAGSALNSALGVVSTTARSSDDESNEGLYALFVLVLIPICCVAAFVMWYKKRSNGDKQYMQDTATFSSVAAGQKTYDPTYGAYQPSMGYDPAQDPTLAYTATPMGYGQVQAPMGYSVQV